MFRPLTEQVRREFIKHLETIPHPEHPDGDITKMNYRALIHEDVQTVLGPCGETVIQTLRAWTSLEFVTALQLWNVGWTVDAYHIKPSSSDNVRPVYSDDDYGFSLFRPTESVD